MSCQKNDIGKCQELFAYFDKKGSQFIKKEELRKVLEGNNYNYWFKII